MTVRIASVVEGEEEGPWLPFTRKGFFFPNEVVSTNAC